MHPPALQSGSLAFQNHYQMPNNNQLIEDRVKELPSEASAFSRTGYACQFSLFEALADNKQIRRRWQYYFRTFRFDLQRRWR